MNTISMNEVVQAVNDLPSLPAILTVLRKHLDEENVRIETVAHSLSQDQALSAKTLRLANSSFYGMQGRIATVQQAITVLGVRQLETLVTAAAITGAFSQQPPALFDFSTFWRHAVATGLCARSLARHTGGDAGEAFIAGLLHDIGRLVLATRFFSAHEKALAFARSNGCSMLEAENAVLGIDHAMVGEALTAHWKFPSAVREAVARHHCTDVAGQSRLVQITHAANILVASFGLHGDDEEETSHPLSSETLASLAVKPDTLDKIRQETREEFEDACQMLVP